MEEGNNCIDIEQWLKSNKLSEIYAVFKRRDVTIEELIEFDENDLITFVKQDLKLDILQSKRFMKGINKIKQKNQLQPLSKPIIKHNVILSIKEQNALTKLYQRFDECSQIQMNIQNTLKQSNPNSLDQNSIKCQNDINVIFMEIKKQILNRKNELLKDIENIKNNKQQILTQQLNTLQSKYIPLIENNKNKYESYVNGSGQKINIIKMVENVLSFNGNQIATTVLATKPEIKYNINYTMNIYDEFLNNLILNDCDVPFQTEFIIVNIEANCVCIKYDIDKKYYDKIGKSLMKIAIEYAIVKNDNDLWSDYKENIDDKNEEKESEETESNSDSQSESENEIESESDNQTMNAPIISNMFGDDSSNDNDIAGGMFGLFGDDDSDSSEGNVFNTQLPPIQKKKRRKKSKKKRKKVKSKQKLDKISKMYMKQIKSDE
eukprot:474475_1